MGLRISRILHAGYVFQSDQTTIAFDPIFENPFSRNCFAFPSVEFDAKAIRKLRFDAVFISHFHDDHFSLESLDLLPRETPIYFYCQFPEFFRLLDELGFKDVTSLNLDQAVQIGSIRVTPHRALDVEVDSLFQIQADGMNVLNVVDSWIDDDKLSELIGLGPWDMVLWPFQTMREIEVLAPSRIPAGAVEAGQLPSEWIDQLSRLNPRFIVPSSCQFIHESWSWFNRSLFPISYKFFASEMKRAVPLSEIIRLDPSKSVELSSDGLGERSPLSWVSPVGDQDVDYIFDPKLSPSPIHEVAANFEILSPIEADRVHEFCIKGLLEKYRTLDPSSEPYFEKTRRWLLRVYDGIGPARDFCYLIQGSQIEIDPGGNEPLGWFTEIPISKLFAALESGESLTSLYIRICDIEFSENIENEIRDVDVIQDPLVRCLYSRDISAYQDAQLKRIEKRAEKFESAPIV